MSRNDLKPYCPYFVIISEGTSESKTTDYDKAEHLTWVYKQETYPGKTLPQSTRTEE